MNWYDFLINQAVTTIFIVLQGVIKNPANKEHMKQTMYDIYFSIQRAYPELVTPPTPGVQP